MALETSSAYDRVRAGFRWRLPDDLNLGVACADRQPPGALALVELREDGSRREVSFGELAQLSNRLANALRGLGIEAGDRVGIVLSQRLETGLLHVALAKLGAIAVPLSRLFGPDALRYRLGDSGTRAVVTDAPTHELVAEVAGELGMTVLDVDRPGSFWALLERGDVRFEPVATGPDTPVLLIYTSGTTGPPKGALHGHRVLIGHLPGFELSHDGFPQPGDRFWTPADWAWIGGLMDALLPAWFHGRTVVGASRVGFDPEWAVRVVEEAGVRNAFLPPTALKLMRRADVRIEPGRLRTAMSGGEMLGAETLAWAREALGVTVNEIYGQTEVNYVVGNSSRLWDVRPGSMGRAYPGHEVAVLREDGTHAPPGEVGEIAVGAPDPVAFLGYWNQPDATREKYTASGEWLLTGDLARADEEGYLWFEARADDVIGSAGYRIGPGEIEECLLRHEQVALAAAIGIPDELRGQVVKAFVKLADGSEPSPELEEEIREFVRRRLAAYEYPREIEFVDELPLTVTGKIRRNELRRLEEERRRKR